MTPSSRVRMATVADAEAIQQIYAPFVTDTSVSFEMVPPTVDEMAQRISTTLQRTPWLVFEQDGRVTGYAYASKHRDRAAYQWSVEVSAYVLPEARRSGVARELYERLFEILATQGFYSAFAGITLPNEASVAFHRALGFRDIGVFHSIGYKFGQWHDTGWLERPLRSYDSPSDPPIPLSYVPCAELTALLSRSD
jgi:phosphinothricin acetyltransferase